MTMFHIWLMLLLLLPPQEHTDPRHYGAPHHKIAHAFRMNNMSISFLCAIFFSFGRNLKCTILRTIILVWCREEIVSVE